MKQIPPQGWQYKAGQLRPKIFLSRLVAGTQQQKRGSPLDDMQQLILDEVRATRKELTEHIKEEQYEFKAIRKDITDLQTTAALQKQRTQTINAFIATVVSAVVAWFVARFGGVS